jgi:hypothetical protein
MRNSIMLISGVLLGAGLMATASFGAATNPNGNGTSSSPSGQAIPADQGATIQATTNTDEKTASVQATVKLPPVSDGQQLLSLTGQTPVGQSTNYTNVASLDGLTKSTSIALKYSYMTSGSRAASESDIALASTNRIALCEADFLKIAGVPLGPLPGEASKPICDHTILLYAAHQAWTPYVELRQRQLDDKIYKAKPGADPNQVLQNVLDESAKVSQVAILMQAANVPATSQKLVSELEAAENLDAANVPIPLWMFSLNSKVGYEQHVYYDLTSLSKSTLNKTPYQFGGEATYVFTSGNESLNLTFNYQQAYQDADKGVTQTKCKVTVSPNINCVTGFIGAPTTQDKALLSLDYRFVGSSLPIIGTRYGIDPGFTYDAKARSEAVQFPVYLMTDSSKNLTGGIRYDWTSTSHVSTVGLFVSAAFSLLPG